MTRLVLGRMPRAVTGAVAGWLLAALPLLLLGYYRPLPAAPLCLAAAGLMGWLTVRRAADVAGPAWAAWATLAMVAGFLVLAWGWSGEHVILRRDAGSYALHAQWLAAHGSLPIPGTTDVFGPDVRFSSPGFYPDGDAVVPQFLAGAPLLLAVGGWLGGLSGILHADAVVGAAAVLAVAGLTARVAGARAAPFAALVTGLCYPVLHAARSPYSEPLALLLLFGGLAVLADRRAPLLGGLLVGLAALARVDAPADLLLLMPYAVLVPSGVRVGVGLAVGVGVGLLDGLVLTRPYLTSVRRELLAIAVAAVVLSLAALALRRRQRPAWLPTVAAGSVAAVAALLWVRPLLQTVRRPNTASGTIGVLQVRQGLTRDPLRTYDEQSLHWVAWWLGLPLLVLAVVGLVLLVLRRVARAPDRFEVAPFLLVLGAAALVVLYRPSITPDHPWADRRLVPVVLPGLAVCAAYALGRLRRPLAVGLGAASLVPLVVATGPLLTNATERGELTVLERLCDRLPPNAAVAVSGGRATNEWPQAIRGECEVPTAVVPGDLLPRSLPRICTAVRASGQQLVAVAENPTSLRAAGLQPSLVASITPREDARLLTRRPTDTVPLRVEIWAAPGLPSCYVRGISH